LDQQKRKERAALLSVAANTVMVAVKVVTGLMIGSLSVLSEAAHSSVDLLAALIALFSVKISNRPADSSHPFGHGKVENVSATVEALLIFVAALWIVWEAADKLLSPRPVETPAWGVAVMALSVVVNWSVSRRLLKVGKEEDSLALIADAWHLRTDVLTSLGVMVSLAAIWLGRVFFPRLDLSWLDPAAAIAVALLIFKAAYDLTIHSARDLLDVPLPRKELDWIRGAIVGQGPDISGFHDLRTRKAGPSRFVEFHLKVNPSLSVKEAHAVAKDLSDRIKGRFPHTTVTSHIEPCDGECTPKCLAGCLLSEEKRAEARRQGGADTAGLMRNDHAGERR